jgi:hypothetical protein
MTKAEKQKMGWLLLLFGLGIALQSLALITFVDSFKDKFSHSQHGFTITFTAGTICVVFGGIWLNLWRFTSRKVICAVQWLKVRGITPEQVKMSPFSRKALWKPLGLLFALILLFFAQTRAISHYLVVSHTKQKSQSQAASPRRQKSVSSEPADLREAKAKLAGLRLNRGENHSEVQSQLQRIQELERLTREEPNAPADLREAKAKLAELRVNYGEKHPVIQSQVARIRELERLTNEQPTVSAELLDARAKLESSTFGSVTERALRVFQAIDLDTGKVEDQNPEKRGSAEGYFPFESMKQKGLDLWCDGAKMGPASMKAKGLGNESWSNMSPQEVVKAVEEINAYEPPPPSLSKPTNGLGTYCFQTREGSIGLLQIFGDCRIRYKLVQSH